MAKIDREAYKRIKEATEQKILVDRPIRDIAKEFGVSPGSVSKIKCSKDWTDFKKTNLVRTLGQYGFTADEVAVFLRIEQRKRGEWL